MKKTKNYFEATTVVLEWGGKKYRVSPDVAEAIKKRKDYSKTAKKATVKKTAKKAETNK